MQTEKRHTATMQSGKKQKVEIYIIRKKCFIAADSPANVQLCAHLLTAFSKQNAGDICSAITLFWYFKENQHGLFYGAPYVPRFK